MHTPVMRVKPWGEGQGDFVEINVEDFNPDVHTPFDAAEKPAETEAKPAAKRAKKSDAADKPAE